MCIRCQCDRMKVRIPDDKDINGKPITLNYNHHCNQGCGHCIFLKEHHCVFVGACAGYRNINYFFLFAFYLIVTCAIHLYFVIMSFYQNDPRYGATGVINAATMRFNPYTYIE